MTIRYFLQLLRKVTKSDDLILSLKIHFFKIFPVKYLLMPLAALRGSLGNIVWSPNPSNIFSKLSQLRGGVDGSSVRKSDNIVHQQSFILKIKNGQNESYKVSNDFSWKVELILKVESGRQQLHLMTS